MPPKEELRMSESLAKIEGVLLQMQQEREFAEKEREFSKEQLRMYQDSIEKSIKFNEERMCDFDTRMKNSEAIIMVARKTLWIFIVAMIPTLITGGAMLDSKVSAEDVDKRIDRLDHATVTDVLDGDYRIIEDFYSTICDQTDMTKEEAINAEVETKNKVYGGVTNYKSRTIEKDK